MGVRKKKLWLENSEYLGSSLNIEKINGYSGTEESIVFAGADLSVDQGTEKSHFPVRLLRDSSSYLALLLVL